MRRAPHKGVPVEENKGQETVDRMSETGHGCVVLAGLRKGRVQVSYVLLFCVVS